MLQCFIFLYSWQGYWCVAAQLTQITDSVISKNLMRCRLHVRFKPYLNELKTKLKGKINFHVIFSNLKAFEAKLSLFHKHVRRNIVSALYLQKTLSHSMRYAID
jgi:hypothetical protein